MEKYSKASFLSMSILTIEELQNFPYDELFDYIKNKNSNASDVIDPVFKLKCIKMWQIRISITLNAKMKGFYYT